MIEGAELIVCGKCSRHGTVVQEELERKPAAALKPEAVRPARLEVKVKGSAQRVSEGMESTLELVEDFNVRVRAAREKLGISHKELGRSIGEKVSVLKKVEAGRVIPDNRLIAKLEHALKVKLLVPVSGEVSRIGVRKAVNQRLTLGNVIQFKERGKQYEGRDRPTSNIV